MLIAVVAAIPFVGFEAIWGIQAVYDSGNPEGIRFLKYLQVVQSLGLFVFPSLVLAWLFHGSVTTYLCLNRKITLASVLLVALLVIISLPAINFMGELNSRMKFPEWLSGLEVWMKSAEESAAELTEAFLKMETVGSLLFNMFMIALLPAIGEELLFRGVIQRIFTNWTGNHHWGIWISAILFSALHIQFYGFLPRMVLGAMFGYLLVWSGSMWLPVLAHFFNNGFAVAGIYLIGKNVIDPRLEDIGSTSDSYYAAVLSIAFIILIFWLVKKENRKNVPVYSVR